MTLKCTMILGDCLEVMRDLPPSSVRMCFADIPYTLHGKRITKNAWDIEFPLREWWAECKKLRTIDSSVVMTANARLMALIIAYFPKEFRYDLVWHKSVPQGYLDAKNKPLRDHELIAVLAEKRTMYNPQMVQGKPFRKRQTFNKNYGKKTFCIDNPTGLNYPRSVFFTRRCPERGVHPTQKPLALLNWLIRTYSHAGDCVLDPVAGSFTTCVSASINGRSSIGIEKDASYFEAGIERVRKIIADDKLDVHLEVRR